MKILIQRAVAFLQSLQQHPVNVTVRQLNLNDATNQKDSIEQFEEKREKVLAAEMIKKFDVEDSIEQFEEKREKVLAAEMIKKFDVEDSIEQFEEKREKVLAAEMIKKFDVEDSIEQFEEKREKVLAAEMIKKFDVEDSIEQFEEKREKVLAAEMIKKFDVEDSIEQFEEKREKVLAAEMIKKFDVEDSIEQFEEKREKVLAAEMIKKFDVEGSIKELKEMHENLVTELNRKRIYLEEVKIVGHDTKWMLGKTTSELHSGLDEITRDIDLQNRSFKTSTEQSNEEDPQYIAVKQKYLEAVSPKTKGTVDNMCRATDELVKRLENIAKEISGKIAHTTIITWELQGSLREVCRELENKQHTAREIRKESLSILGVSTAVFAATSIVLTGGLAAPLLAPMGVAAVATLAGTHAAMKYMERQAFKKAQTQWNCYGKELNGSGLLWIIGKEMINDRQSNEYARNAGIAFQEMHIDYANSEKIANRYFKDRNHRMVAYFIFSGIDFIEFLKWLFSLSEPMEFHINGFIDTELAGIRRALEKMATDIDRN